MKDNRPAVPARVVTSVALSGRAILACWITGLSLLGAGVWATFEAGTGASPAAMILFGALFLLVALMKRVPLRLEVGSAKLDASYEADKAFDAGREGGLQQGVEAALEKVDEAAKEGASSHEVSKRLRNLARLLATDTVGRTVTKDLSWTLDVVPRIEATSQPRRLYTESQLRSAAGVSLRQIDYWVRTGLVETDRDASGTRWYSEREIVVATVTRRLLEAGVSLQQIRIAVDSLRHLSEDRLIGVTLISDGDTVYMVTRSEEVTDLILSGRGMFSISVGSVAREVQRALM